MTKKTQAVAGFSSQQADAYQKRSKATYVILSGHSDDFQLKAVSHLATTPPDLAALAKENGHAMYVPKFNSSGGAHFYVPGSGVRSKLRGALTFVQFTTAKERGDSLSLVDAQYNRLGGVKQDGKEPEVSTEAATTYRAQNPNVSLFGASAPWISGKAMIGGIITKDPNVQLMTCETVRASMVRRQPGIVDFLGDDAQAAINATRDQVKNSVAAKKQIKALDDKRKKATSDQERLDIQNQINQLEGNVYVSEQNIQRGYQAIPPGTLLTHRVNLLNVDQIELGAFIRAMRKFADEPLVGGHHAHGAGQIAGKWEVRVGSTSMGSIEIVDFSQFVVEGDVLKAAEAAYEEFLASTGFVAAAPVLEKAGDAGE